MRPATALAGILATNYQMDVAGVEDFVAGLMLGLIKKNDLPEIQKCLQNSSSLEVEITNAVSDISKGDIPDIIKGVQEIGQIVKELPTDLADCKNLTADIQKIEAWATIFSDPKKLLPTLAENVIHNFGQISSDVSKVSTDFSGKSYENAGEDIADILVESVGPIGEVIMSLY